MAVNCCVPPLAIDGLLGVTAIDIRVVPDPVIVSVIGMLNGELISCGEVISKAPV